MFVQIVAAAERYLIITHMQKNSESWRSVEDERAVKYLENLDV